MKCKHVSFSRHAVERMFEREIDKAGVIEVLRTGEVIAEYLDDKPYPSYLLLGFITSSRPLHVVVAREDDFCHVITAYDPDLSLWELNFKKRRSS